MIRPPSSTAPMGIVHVVDDDAAIRDSVHWLLSAHGFGVQCHASAEAFIRVYDPAKIACAFIDVRMGGQSGLELQDWALHHAPALPLCFITGHGDVSIAVAVMKKGACDLLEKPFAEQALIDLARRMLLLASERRARWREGERLQLLSPREREVFELLAKGRQNKQVAQELAISAKTVETHRAHILEKLEVRSVAELARIALAAAPSLSR